MAEIAISILGKIAEYLAAPIGRQLGYLIGYKNIIENLRYQVENLAAIRDSAMLSIDAARRNLEVISPDVLSWLFHVEKIMMELEIFFVDYEVWHSGRCMNPKFRYILSRKASRMVQDVSQLREEGKMFARLSYPAPPAGIAASTLASGSKGFQSRMPIIKGIMDALRDDRVSMIGVFGMAGIGKTTMVEQVAKRAFEMNFDEVAMAVVSQNQDLKNIQGQLADMLGLELEEDVLGRAVRLHARLMHRQSILVILDDVWEAIDMGEIGIPIGDDCKKCKVVFTSRDKDVLIRMGSQRTFSIGPLFDEEAWDLFKEIAGECVESPNLRSIAREVAKKCQGLPLEIVTWGKNLRNRKINAWIDALRQQRKSTMTNISRSEREAYSTIESTYNDLGREDAKSLFRLCCWFPKDEVIPIEMLIRYGLGLQLFKDDKSLVKARKRVGLLVEELIRCDLLVAGHDGFVKVPDVACDVGRDESIALKEGNAYLLLNDTGLTECSEDDMYKSYTAISIYSNEMHELPDCLDCAELKLLSLECGHDGLEISRDIFEGMKDLQVIDLRINIVEPLPPSLQFLRNLRTLCLDFCSLCDISLIGGLHKLEILSFFKSEIGVLPSKIRHLKKLKLLDLRCTRGPSIIPFGVLSGLKGLEELYMGNYFDPRHVVEHNQGKSANAAELNSLSCLKALHNQGKSANAAELNSLSCLKALQISITLDNEFLRNFKKFQFQNLIGFDFSMFDVESLPLPRYHFSNSVALYGVDMSEISGNVNELMRKTERLSLAGLSDLKNHHVIELDKEVFVNLKRLNVSNCREVHYVIDALNSGPDNAIFDLESLDIAEMYKLRAICNGSLPLGSFGRLQEMSLMELPNMSHLWTGHIQLQSLGNLRVLKMQDCRAIRSLFPSSAVNCLVQLQELKITKCQRLEEVVSKEAKKDTEKMEFPKLKILSLSQLPEFRSFYPEPKDKLDSYDIGPLFSQQVSLANMEVLDVRNLNINVLILGGQMQAWSLHNLQALRVFECVPLVAVFDFERLQLGGELEEVMFNRLETMDLFDLPMLTHIWRKVPKGIQGFHNLRTLQVSSCSGMTYLLSISMAKMLGSLQDLTIMNCESMQEVIGTEEEDSSVVEMVDKMFPKLHVLRLEDLESLHMFYYRKHDFELALMEKIFISNCPNMKKFCSGQVTAPKLERVHVKSHNFDEWVWKGDLNNTIEFLREKGKLKMHKTAYH